MPATRCSTLFIALVLSSQVGCAVEGGDDPLEEGSVILQNPEDEGKSDSVWGKQLRYSFTAELGWPGWDQVSYTMWVRSQTQNSVRVEGRLHVFGDLADRVFQAWPDEMGIDPFSSYSLLVFERGPADAHWRLLQCGSTTYFQEISIDSINREIDITPSSSEDDLTLAFHECNLFNDGQEADWLYGVFAFPHSGFGSLEGRYDLTIKARCGGDGSGRESCPENGWYAD